MSPAPSRRPRPRPPARRPGRTAPGCSATGSCRPSSLARFRDQLSLPHRADDDRFRRDVAVRIERDPAGHAFERSQIAADARQAVANGPAIRTGVPEDAGEQIDDVVRRGAAVVWPLPGVGARVRRDELRVAVPRLVHEVSDGHPDALGQWTVLLDAAESVAAKRRPVHTGPYHLTQGKHRTTQY